MNLEEILERLTVELNKEMLNLIEEVRRNMMCQDGRCTGNPIWVVYSGETGNPNDSMFIQAFFTQVGAERFVELEQYNYPNMWIWIKSGNMNPEWRMIRHLLGGSD